MRTNDTPIHSARCAFANAIHRPSGGELLVDGLSIGQMSDDEVTLYRRRRVGFVFQFFNLLPTLTALENIKLPFVLDGRAGPEAASRAQSLLERIGLQNRKDHLPDELSGGEIQRVAIARALAFSPPLLLADEPTGNLDSRNGRTILELLRDIKEQDGCTVVMVTHSEEAAGYGDGRIFLRDGRVEKEAS